MSNKNCTLYIKSFDHFILEKTTNRIKNTANIFGIKIKGPVRLPTKIKKFTVIRSPHVNKKSREQFEIRTYKRLLTIENTLLNSVKNFLKYLNKNLPVGVSIKITEYNYKNIKKI